MFSEAELIDAIDELTGGKHSIQNCEKLASIFTVLDHLYGRSQQSVDTGYSRDNRVNDDIIKKYGNSYFLSSIEGRNAKEVWLIVDELIEALGVLEPRLLSSFYEKLNI